MRYWTCRGCKTRHPRRKQKCPCGNRRPNRQTSAQKALSDPYEKWEAEFGSVCNICGREPSARRRLDRDHDHATGAARGLLCARCNRALPNWMTAEWLTAAAAYLSRAVVSSAPRPSTPSRGVGDRVPSSPPALSGRGADEIPAREAA